MKGVLGQLHGLRAIRSDDEIRPGDDCEDGSLRHGPVGVERAHVEAVGDNDALKAKLIAQHVCNRRGRERTGIVLVDGGNHLVRDHDCAHIVIGE